jgi:hypothetical protein
MALLVRKVRLLVIGYDELFVYPRLAEAFASFKTSSNTVLCAVGYALWRRLVQKPARLGAIASARGPVADRGDHDLNSVRRLPSRQRSRRCRNC